MSKSKRKPSGYWTLENCISEGKKYTTVSEFRKLSGSCYTIVCKNNWLDEVCVHMTRTFKKIGHWNEDNCLIEALKYETRDTFQRKSKGAYQGAKRLGCLDRVCVHMTLAMRKPWTKKECHVEALKYDSRGTFSNDSAGAYQASNSKGWLDEICSHMTVQECLKDRYIYSFEFPLLKTEYIGLSWNVGVRYKRHMLDVTSSVNKFIVENGLSEKDFNLTELGYYKVNDAGSKENFYIDDYKEKGWVVLNKMRGGSLGSSRLLWTKEKCHEVALLFTQRKKFQLGYKGAYKRAHIEGWLDEICSHMEIVRKKWTYETCKEEASKYKRRCDFKIGTSGAYDKAMKMGWMDEFIPSLKKIKTTLDA